jgi:RimJ/RimL family protein N-acetyltransferase
VTENRRNQGIATEAMRVAIADVWGRAGVESVTAYIEEDENEPSRRLAASLGFTVRSGDRRRASTLQGEVLGGEERDGT